MANADFEQYWPLGLVGVEALDGAQPIERRADRLRRIRPAQHLQRYLDETAWRWNRRQRPEVRGTAGRHRIWRPVPVLAQMSEFAAE